MSVTIVKVESASQLKSFVRFPYTLYKNCPNYVPSLETDEFDAFNPKINGAYEFCECEQYLAYKGGELSGRVAAIINHNANKKTGEKTVRFGWLDFTEDIEVLKSLIEAVSNFGKSRGCTAIKGPWGFTDMDKEGSLVEGYEHLSPVTCLYNYPYYDTLLKDLGFEKDVDWTQSVLNISEELPSMFQYADLVSKRFGLSMVRCKTMKELINKYALSLFQMYNESFAPLYQFTPLSDKQIKRYIQSYKDILVPDYLALCLNSDGKPIGFIFCMPSLSKAFQKAKGKLFPFGFTHVLRALKHNDTLEALMIGILPEYQGKGVNVLMFKYIHENCIKNGIKRIILNPQLEHNYKVQSLFEEYNPSPFMRRRAYIKQL